MARNSNLRATCFTAIALAAALIGGCNDVYDAHVTHNHACNVHTNGAWNSANLYAQLDHTDPTSCPIAASVGSFLSSAATVTDLNADFEEPGTIDTFALEVTGWDQYYFDPEPIGWSGSFQLEQSSSYEDFVWDNDSSGAFVWRAFGYVDFAAADSPDWMEHTVHLYSTVDKALAVVELEYSGGPGPL